MKVSMIAKPKMLKKLCLPTEICITKIWKNGTPQNIDIFLSYANSFLL